jgi:hypothetical protein
LILGFQATLFKWGLEREAEVGDKGDIPWLVPSDYISIAGMLILVFGVILLPVSGRISETTARMLFGLGALFFVGQALGLAATINSTIGANSVSSYGFHGRKKS